jgi:hypothetical protein
MARRHERCRNQVNKTQNITTKKRVKMMTLLGLSLDIFVDGKPGELVVRCSCVFVEKADNVCKCESKFNG